MSRNRPLTVFASFPTVPLTDHLPSGDGLVACNIVKQLAKRGHRIYIATPKAELSAPFQGDVHLMQMNRSDDRTRPGALAFMRWTRQILRDVSRTDTIDLIHELNPVFSLRSLAFAGTGIPVVLGPHSSRWPETKAESFPDDLRRRTRALLKDLCIERQHSHAAAVLLSTVAALNNVARPELLAGKLFLLPPGIDTQEFSPAESLAPTQPTVLYLANVIARKGIFTVIDAFARVAQRMPDARLIVAGDGDGMMEARRRIDAFTLQERVEFLGRVCHSEVASAMRRCSVYCLPSYGEPFGMTAIEAMACARPLVVTRAGGLAHLVSEQGGRSVDVNAPAALAEALEELLTQPELCRKMGAHNRAEVERTYAWPVVAARLERIYRDVLTGEARRNPDLLTDDDFGSYRLRMRATNAGARAGALL